MALKNISDRQTRLVAAIDFDFDDITAGEITVAVPLPQSTILLDGFVLVVTSFNSGTSDTIDVGDAGAPTTHLAAGNLAAAAGTRIALGTLGGLITNSKNLTIRWNAVGAAATAGRAILVVEYAQAGRANVNEA